MSEFAKNLKKYRKMKNISQEKLGKSLNYGSTAIANYESGRNEPSIDSLIKIAEVLDVTIDDLLGMKRKTGEKQLLSADVNEDTIIDIHDVIMLQQWIIAAGVPEA